MSDIIKIKLVKQMNELYYAINQSIVIDIKLLTYLR